MNFSATVATTHMADALEREMTTYNAKLNELLASVGKFVLIKGDVIEGIFDTYADALKIGYERFKLEPFMVKQIAPAEQIQFFTRELDLPCRQSTPT
jgi:hypothetical protein